MTKLKKQAKVPEWASRIIALRRQLKMSQGELARRVECSAMTVSRWERGMQAPTADCYIQLGRLAGKEQCWFFWEHAGLQIADVARSLPGTRAGGPLPAVPPLENASAGAKVSPVARQKLSLDMIPSSKLMGAPSDWCPNPRYTSLLRVKGRSMEPLIHDSDILAVDSFQTNKAELDGKVVVVTHEEEGLCVSRLRRYEGVELLESENHEHDSVVLGKSNGWRIVGKVLWWISAAP